MLSYRIFRSQINLEIEMFIDSVKVGIAQSQINFDDVRCDSTIFHFEICPKYRHKGYGTHLGKKILSELRTKGNEHIRIIIGTEPDKKTVISFLKKIGFTKANDSQKYYNLIEGELKSGENKNDG